MPTYVRSCIYSGPRPSQTKTSKISPNKMACTPQSSDAGGAGLTGAQKQSQELRYTGPLRAKGRNGGPKCHGDGQ